MESNKKTERIIKWVVIIIIVFILFYIIGSQYKIIKEQNEVIKQQNERINKSNAEKLPETSNELLLNKLYCNSINEQEILYNHIILLQNFIDKYTISPNQIQKIYKSEKFNQELEKCIIWEKGGKYPF